MASQSVTINGILWDHAWKTPRKVTLVGEAYLTGLEPGYPLPPEGPGWPDEPPPRPQPKPPGFWGPTDPRPTPPIAFPPEYPDPPAGGGDKPPPEEGGWGYWADISSWVYKPAPGSGAGPKR